jgi:transposase InsO family protein
MVMEKTYYDASQPGSYGGIRPLVRYSAAPVRSVKGWLNSQEAYILHRPARRRFIRRRTFAKGPNDLFQADLCDMSKLARYNDTCCFILTVISVFSKYAFTQPLRDKRGQTVANAFDRIFALITPQMNISTDRGNEFYNRHVAEVFKKYAINHFSPHDEDIKCGVIERFNRTLKTRIFRYLTHKSTSRWIDVLPDLTESYNNSYHRSIGMAPSQVNARNEDEVAKRLYPPVKRIDLKFKFNVGDTVRISRLKPIFFQRATRLIGAKKFSKLQSNFRHTR